MGAISTVPTLATLAPRLANLRPIRTVHRRLLPRRPHRDASLEQLCTLYANASADTDDGSPETTTLVLTPITHNGSSLPYYHPPISHLALRYIPNPPLLRVEVIPLPNTNTPTDPSSRLYRTCLALLRALHRYGWGATPSYCYSKRVSHDRIVPREAYQDLYLVMRERYKYVVDSWCEVTDPLKHVFEVRFFSSLVLFYYFFRWFFYNKLTRDG
jgi:tRNASer (uridine44-2'-O)-methyltransferase